MLLSNHCLINGLGLCRSVTWYFHGLIHIHYLFLHQRVQAQGSHHGLALAPTRCLERGKWWPISPEYLDGFPLSRRLASHSLVSSPVNLRTSGNEWALRIELVWVHCLGDRVSSYWYFSLPIEEHCLASRCIFDIPWGVVGGIDILIEWIGHSGGDCLLVDSVGLQVGRLGSELGWLKSGRGSGHGPWYVQFNILFALFKN